MTEFDPFEMCRILNEERVDYVVLGGFAANLRGSPITTRDLDVIPARALENLDRLGRALTRMNAMIRISGEPVPTKIDGAFLANMPQMLNLATDFGDLDLTFTPAGRAGGYEGWKSNATSELIDEGLVVSVAALDDIIDSKRTANRAKDHVALPYLESLRDELRRQSGEQVARTNRGVPPFGHTSQLRVFIDPDLLQYDDGWAAAGTWHDVFGIEPLKLVEASGGELADLRRG